MGPFPRGTDPYFRHILVIIDYFSRFVRTFPASSDDHITVDLALQERGVRFTTASCFLWPGLGCDIEQSIMLAARTIAVETCCASLLINELQKSEEKPKLEPVSTN